MRDIGISREGGGLARETQGDTLQEWRAYIGILGSSDER